MNSFELLKDLMKELEAYEEKAKDKDALSMDEFIQSLSLTINLDNVKNSFVKKATVSPDESKRQVENNIERVISQHVLILYRYTKYYSKMALAESEIKSIEDFSFLITLMQHTALPKTELINRNIYEKSTGIEVINRLIKSKLLTQKPNPEDKRSQLVVLTERGRAALFDIFHKMNDLGIVVSGDLTEGEKKTLAILLKKLDRFHFDNYHHIHSEKLKDYLPKKNKG